MYGVRTRRGFRGLGTLDVSNPAACGFTDLGVTKGICWCLSVGQTICDWFNGPGSYVAAVASQSPDVAYPPLATPPAPQAVTSAGFPQQGAGTLEQAQAATDAVLAAAKAQANQQNLDYFKQVQGNLDQLATNNQNPNPLSGTLSTTTLVALGIAAGVGLLLLTSGSGRRR